MLASCGALAAALGGALIGAGAAWAYLNPGSAEGLRGGGALAVFFWLSGAAGVALAVASLGVLYALMVRARPGSGVALVAAVGATLAFVSLVALAWVVSREPFLAAAEDAGRGSFLFSAAAVVASWGRAFAVFAFCAAAFMAGTGRWFLLLLVVGLTETPAVVAGAHALFGASDLAGLLLGEPGVTPAVRPGLFVAAAWVLVGYALMESGFEPDRWGLEPRRFRRSRRRSYR